MFSQGLSSLKNAASTETRLTCRRTDSGCATTSQPKTIALPASGVSNVPRTRDEMRLAPPVGPEDPGPSPRLDHQVELVQGDLLLPRALPPRRAVFALAVAKRFADPLDLNRGCRHQLLLK